MCVNEYAELFDEEVGRVLDSHAPLQTRRRRLLGLPARYPTPLR